MADVKISALPSIGSANLASTDIFVVNVSGITSSVSTQKVAAGLGLVADITALSGSTNLIQSKAVYNAVAAIRTPQVFTSVPTGTFNTDYFAGDIVIL
jgi:hypothetical protein